MWVEIVRLRRFNPDNDHRVCILYTPGLVVSVKRAWGEQLIAEGDAVPVKTPPRKTRS